VSIDTLRELQKETRRIFIAGGGLVRDDFQIKKLIPLLKETGKSSAVFGRIAELAEKAVSSGDDNAPENLLELGIMLNAVLYTQGNTDIPGEPVDMKSNDIGMETKHSFRKLKPVITALTVKGEGRVRIIESASESGLTNDLRLFPVLVDALDDPYINAEAMLSKILKPEMLPFFEMKFDINGNKKHGKVLELIYKLAGEDRKDLYVKSLENGSEDVKISAIKILKNFGDAEQMMINATLDSKKDVRKEAYDALSCFNSDVATGRLMEAFAGKDKSLVENGIKNSGSKKIADHLLDNLKPFLEKIDSGIISEKEESKMKYYLSMLNNKNHDEVFLFLKDLIENKFKKMSELKSPSKTESLAYKTGEALLSLDDKKYMEYLESIASLYGNYYVGLSFKAGFSFMTPEKLYDRYAGFASNKKMKSEIFAVFEELSFPYGGRKGVVFDARWLDVFVNEDQIDLVLRSLNFNHPAAVKYLLKKIDLGKKHKSSDIYDILRKLGEINYEKFDELVVEFVKHIIKTHDKAAHFYDQYYLLGFIERVKKSTLKEIKSLVNRCDNDGIKEKFNERIDMLDPGS
jgi:hypothetical protein